MRRLEKAAICRLSVALGEEAAGAFFEIALAGSLADWLFDVVEF